MYCLFVFQSGVVGFLTNVAILSESTNHRHEKEAKENSEFFVARSM